MDAPFAMLARRINWEAVLHTPPDREAVAACAIARACARHLSSVIGWGTPTARQRKQHIALTLPSHEQVVVEGVRALDGLRARHERGARRGLGEFLVDLPQARLAEVVRVMRARHAARGRRRLSPDEADEMAAELGQSCGRRRFPAVLAWVALRAGE